MSATRELADTGPHPSTVAATPGGRIGGVRKDVQALRAVAVLLVVFYHLWPNRLSGGFIGVDVFFVISGFLITGGLVAKPDVTPRVIVGFWERRLRRLLPAGLLVIIVTLAASRLLAPATEWARAAKEAIAATFYVQNWVLADGAVDYLAAENEPSAFQHYWSLSVEEQFYIVWPLLLWIALWVCARRGIRPTRPVQVLIGVVVLASFSWSLYATAANPASAYFVTPTRMWELGLGGFFAVRASKLVARPARGLPRDRTTARALAAWLGLALIAVSAFTITGSMPFPGWIAAVPVIGATLFLAAASHDGPLSPERIGGWRPVQWMGDISYSVYLWHWPLIVLLPYVSGDLGRLDKATILVATCLLATASKRFVEDRWRRPTPRTQPRRVYLLALTGMLIIALLGSLQIHDVNRREAAERAELEARLEKVGGCLGAGSLLAGREACPRDPAGEVVPSPALAAKDKSEIYSERCMVDVPYEEVRQCTFGDGSVDVALAGNSHSSHWLPTLRELAEEYDLRITTFIGSQCSTVENRLEFDTEEHSEGCHAWAQEMRELTEGDEFDLVITSQRNVHPVQGYTMDESGDPLEEGFRDFLDGWLASGTQILVIHDTPYPRPEMGEVPSCVGENLTDQNACSGARDDVVPDDPLHRAASSMDAEGLTTADFTDAICEPERCYAVNGGVITYFDGSHLTSTFSRTLAPALEPVLAEALNGG